LNNKS